METLRLDIHITFISCVRLREVQFFKAMQLLVPELDFKPRKSDPKALPYPY